MSKNKRPSVKALLAEARLVQTREPYVTADEFGLVLDTLHRKGLSWKEVNEWCAARGHQWSIGGMTAGWNRWAAAQAKKQAARKKR